MYLLHIIGILYKMDEADDKDDSNARNILLKNIDKIKHDYRQRRVFHTAAEQKYENAIRANKITKKRIFSK
jgi:hypothetical protein